MFSSQTFASICVYKTVLYQHSLFKLVDNKMTSRVGILVLKVRFDAKSADTTEKTKIAVIREICKATSASIINLFISPYFDKILIDHNGSTNIELMPAAKP